MGTFVTVHTATVVLSARALPDLAITNLVLTEAFVTILMKRVG